VYFLLLLSELSAGAWSGRIFSMFFHAVVKETVQNARGLIWGV